MADSALEALLAQAKRGGDWGTKYVSLVNAPALTIQVLNAVPTGRSFGVIHQLAYWGSIEGLQATLTRFPNLNLSLLTKQGQTPLQVAQEAKRQAFVDFLNGLLAAQAAQQKVTQTPDSRDVAVDQSANPVALQLCEAAKNGKWNVFHDLLSDEKKVDVSLLNVVPKGKRWGVIHQIAYWGKIDELDFLTKKFPKLNLALETSEDTPQTALDIAKGKGHKDFASALSLNTSFVQSVAAMTIAAPPTLPSDAPPISCLLCLEEFPAGTAGAICSVDKHFTCQECFGSYVLSESDIDQNTSGILLKGGVLFCAAEKIKDGCKSPAFSNKLVAACVNEATYDAYLKARDFVVGKDAAAKALQKVSAGLDTVEQEQIRNLFRNPDGTYRAFQCANCKFGPVDHGWCSNLMSHNEEKKAGGGVVKNSCPRCNWFAGDISQWPRWDGKFTSFDGPKVPPQPSKPPSNTGQPIPTRLTPARLTPARLTPAPIPQRLPYPSNVEYPCKGRPFSNPSEGGIVCSSLVQQSSDWNCVSSVGSVFEPKKAPPARRFELLDAGRALLTKEEAQAVGHRWAADGVAEHASVASFARHTLELMAVGAPPEILVAAQRAGGEEVGHAQLCFGLARKYGVIVEPGAFPLPKDSGAPSLLSMTLGVATEGCVAEFGSCMAASLQLARATMPAVKCALQQIAKEEAGHCVLAWRTLLWAVNKLRTQNDANALESLSEAFQVALNDESKQDQNVSASDKDSLLLEDLLTILPELGLLTPRLEGHVRALTAQTLTRGWVEAVLSGHRPCAPDSTLLSNLDPSLAQLASQIHQAVFYQDPMVN